MWLVKREDANDVLSGDFELDSSVLLGMHPKTLVGSAVHWHISEKELFVMVYGVVRFGKLITEVVSRWALQQDQTGWSYLENGQLVVTIAKI